MVVVGTIFVCLVLALVWSIFYGRRVIRTEKTDAVFGNPVRALGGWHWVVCGVSSLLIFWLWFSWDAGRAFFPGAANELCQVAKLNRAVNPIRSAYPIDNRYLLGTRLLERDFKQIELLYESLAGVNFNETDRKEVTEVIDLMHNALEAQANSEYLSHDTVEKFADAASRINHVANELTDPDYPGPADSEALEKALSQPGWGESSAEIPVLPTTDRGRAFDAAAEVMEGIAEDYGKIRNDSAQITAMIAEMSQRIEAFVIDESGTEVDVERREELLSQVKKISKRVDNLKVFPSETTDAVEAALRNLDAAMDERQGMLRVIDIWAMPGGEILAGNNACSEQGSGRWLPKPSDTLATFVYMAHPDKGYKGFPLLWFKMKPVSEMVGFILPDWIANLMPGEHARHNDQGVIETRFKDKVYNIVTGNFNSFSVPVPTGHIWDSIMRVLAGLFLGVILGVPLGLFMGLSRFAKGYFDPLVELYRPVPPLAWAPLILTIFGIQDDGKIFLLFMVAFAIMVISARTGATGTQLSKIHAAHSLGASSRQIVRQVILPNSLPEILTGIRISIGVCWGTLVAAEMLAGTTGIGFVENVARKQSDYEIIWMTIIVMGVLGLIFDMIMRFVIDKTIPWRGKG
ncbi:MAG: ABC transporter permease [Acidiferrobacterales bacterium]|nr:ABC transporter permease [Acidiferrobacterales bacterium]